MTIANRRRRNGRAPAAAEPPRPSEVATPAPAASSPPVGSVFPPLPPPPATEQIAAASERSRNAFRQLNRWFAVPLHRAGLAAWLGTPMTGCQLLLTTTGRKTGQRRDTPLGYLVAEGAAWVLAGFGPSTHWYLNLRADPRVEVLLPGRPPVPGRAEEILDPAVRGRIIPPLVRSMALPGGLIGTNPATASDEHVLELVAWVPLVRISPDGPPLVAGPDDPGGSAWVWRQGVVLVASVLVLGWLWRLIRR